jgi:FO synthase
VLSDAGRVGVPFTTGILIGIGETLLERAESLHALRRIGREYGHLQEVIVQNFRAKPDTAMRGMPDADAATTWPPRWPSPAGPRPEGAHPGPAEPAHGDGDAGATSRLLLRAGIDDWGGVSPVTPDHVNPERPWPQIDGLRSSAEAGFELRERLTIYPEYVRAGRAPWLDPRLAPHVLALADPSTGLAAEARPVGLPWQEPDATVDSGRVDLLRHHRHRRPDRRPALRLRHRLRRLGGGGHATRGDRRTVPVDGDVEAALPLARRPGRAPAASTRIRRWRCSRRTVRRWTSWSAWPTTCAATRSATTSPTW